MAVKRYNACNLLIQGLFGHTGWQPAWSSPKPKARYDVIIIGGGGHGLATAYYLAKNHNIRDIAVLEKGWIGGGNSGRNTTIVRSNYYYPENARLYDFSLRLYESLAQELNYNIMFSPRGLISVAHSRRDMEVAARWVGAMSLNGVTAALLSKDEVHEHIPLLDRSGSARYPVLGGFIQARAGTARHDAVVWGYARAANTLGVDIIQGCAVSGFERSSTGRVRGVVTNRGKLQADKVAIAVAGHSSHLAGMAGFRLPISSFPLQAFVSEPLKPILNCVMLSLATGLYISQSDKGGLVLGGGMDHYTSYAQRGGMPVIRNVIRTAVDQMPSLGRVRLLRQWAGIVDMVPDSSPLIGETPVPGLYMNCGWGTGGFKAIPAGGWVLAHHIATGRAHPLAAPFGLERFSTGALLDEAAISGLAH